MPGEEVGGLFGEDSWLCREEFRLLVEKIRLPGEEFQLVKSFMVVSSNGPCKQAGCHSMGCAAIRWTLLPPLQCSLAPSNGPCNRATSQAASRWVAPPLDGLACLPNKVRCPI